MTPRLSSLFAKSMAAKAPKRRRALLIAIMNEVARPRPTRLTGKRLRQREIQPQEARLG